LPLLSDRRQRPRADRRSGREGPRVLRDLRHQVFDRVVELCVLAVDEPVRTEIELDVRVDAVPFDLPAAPLRIPAAELGLRRHAAVPKRLVASDPDPSSPGPGSDHRPEPEVLEALREGLAVAASLAID